MKNKIKLMAFILAAMSVLSSCGEKKQEAVGKMTISWLPQCDSPVDADSPVMAKIEEELGIDIDLIYIDRSKKTELLNVRIAAGEIPDVFSPPEANTFGQYCSQCYFV